MNDPTYTRHPLVYSAVTGRLGVAVPAEGAMRHVTWDGEYAELPVPADELCELPGPALRGRPPFGQGWDVPADQVTVVAWPHAAVPTVDEPYTGVLAILLHPARSFVRCEYFTCKSATPEALASVARDMAGRVLGPAAGMRVLGYTVARPGHAESEAAVRALTRAHRQGHDYAACVAALATERWDAPENATALRLVFFRPDRADAPVQLPALEPAAQLPALEPAAQLPAREPADDLPARFIAAFNALSEDARVLALERGPLEAPSGLSCLQNLLRHEQASAKSGEGLNAQQHHLLLGRLAEAERTLRHVVARDECARIADLCAGVCEELEARADILPAASDRPQGNRGIEQALAAVVVHIMDLAHGRNWRVAEAIVDLLAEGRTQVQAKPAGEEP